MKNDEKLTGEDWDQTPPLPSLIGPFSFDFLNRTGMRNDKN